MTSCIPREKKEELPESIACPMIAVAIKSSVDFHLKSLVSDDYKLLLDGKELAKDCLSNSPCISETLFVEETMRLGIFYGHGYFPPKVDFTLIEVLPDLTEIKRVDQFDVLLNWKEYKVSFIPKECQTFYQSKIEIFE